MNWKIPQLFPIMPIGKSHSQLEHRCDSMKTKIALPCETLLKWSSYIIHFSQIDQFGGAEKGPHQRCGSFGWPCILNDGIELFCAHQEIRFVSNLFCDRKSSQNGSKRKIFPCWDVVVFFFFANTKIFLCFYYSYFLFSDC